MSADIVRAGVSRLAAIGLAELVERAALQTRTDRKYVLPMSEVDRLLAELDPDTEVLEIDGMRVFTYETVYFDTPTLTSYLLTAYRRRRRFKVRTRSYLDSSQCWLEVKVPGPRGSTVKHRVPHAPQDNAMLHSGRRFVDDVLAGQRIAVEERAEFAPTLTTQYRRSTLFLPASGSRVTIDTDLCWCDGPHALDLPGLAVVETKSRAQPSSLDRRLWRRGHRPTRISKYATGLAALRTDLPAAPWRRFLRQHLTTD